MKGDKRLSFARVESAVLAVNPDAVKAEMRRDLGGCGGLALALGGLAALERGDGERPDCAGFAAPPAASAGSG